MFRKIIIINGSARTGKDSFIDLFYEKTKIPVCNISTIEEAESILFSLETQLGLKQERSLKTDLYRSVLHDVKKLLIKYGDRPLKQTIKKATHLETLFSDSIIFIHCREGEEIAKLVDYYKKRCITLLIKRNIDVPQNPADMGVEKYFGYHMVIDDFDMNKMDVYAEKLKGLIYGQN